MVRPAVEAELRRQLGILKKQLDALPLPHVATQTLAFVNASDNLLCSAIGRAGEAYLLYAHVRLPGKKDNAEQPEPVDRKIEAATLTIDLPIGSYRVWQINTHNGSELEMEPLKSDGKPVSIKLAPFQTDTALRVVRS